MRALTLTLALAAAAAAGPATATVFAFEAFLDGPSEFPPVASPGTGHSVLLWDDVANTFDLNVTWSGLLGTTTIAHIHAPTAVAGTGTAPPATTVPSFPGFPGGLTAGEFNLIFGSEALGSYNPAFVAANGGTGAGAEAAFVAALNGGQAYINIHTVLFPGGEIRGFYEAVPLNSVPEPATWALMIAGFGLAGAALRGRRRAQVNALG